MNEDEDIFDKIMGIRLFKPVFQVYKKYKEVLLYLFFGGLTFFLAIAVFIFLNPGAGVDPLTANIISWICGVTFSFFTTRKWVFKHETSGISRFVLQMAEFYLARTGTLLLQEVLIFIFVWILSVNSVLVKVCTEIINIVLNYIVSKWIIFTK